MTQQPGPWEQGQGGPPPQGPSGPPPGYPQGQPGYGGQPGFGGPPGYGQQRPPGYGQQPPPGFPGYGPQPGYGGGRGPGGGPAAPKKKSTGLILGLVGGALALLVLIGGIALVFGGDDGDQPTTTITPGAPTPPPDDPTTEPSAEPSDEPSDEPSASSSPEPDPKPSTGGGGSSGDAIDLGLDIALVPAEGWEVGKQSKGLAQLTNGEEIFLGQAVQLEAGTNPGQLCTAWHKQVAEGAANAKYADPEKIDLGSSDLSGATCMAQVTVSSGQGSSEVLVHTAVSVREDDGVTVLGTVYFTKGSDIDQVNTDFSTMVGSMLKTQAAG